MKRIRVLYSGDTNALNGAALYVARLMKHAHLFEKRGYQLILSEDTVISRSYSGNPSEYNKSKMYQFKSRVRELLDNSKVGSLIYIYFAWLKHAKRVAGYKNTHREDYILANDIFCAYYAIKRGIDTPIILVMHNSGNPFTMILRSLPKANNIWINKLFRKISSTVYKNAAAVVFVSETSKELFSKENPDYVGIKIHITEGLEDIPCNYMHDYKYLSFITIGSVCRRKNQFSILTAFHDENVQNASLYVIGAGEDYERCRKYVEQNSLTNVDMVGAVENNSIVSWLNQCNIFILNSFDEGLPAVGIEALRNGLPIIISDVGGCRELVDGNGFVIKPGDEKELRQAIRKCVNGKVDLYSMSQKSRILYEEKYTIERMVDQYIDLFKRID